MSWKERQISLVNEQIAALKKAGEDLEKSMYVRRMKLEQKIAWAKALEGESKPGEVFAYTDDVESSDLEAVKEAKKFMAEQRAMTRLKKRAIRLNEKLARLTS